MSTSLYALLSPAKLMDETQRYSGKVCSQPHFLEEAKVIAAALKKCKASEIKSMLAISDDLTRQTVERIQSWNTPILQERATLAIQLFKGEVYRGLDAMTLNEKDLTWAQEHIGILSGWYGLLRAKDLVLPYRLMMGTRFAPTTKDRSLYSYWTAKITDYLNAQIDPKGYIVQLASDEYFKVIDRKKLKPQVIVCDFLENKNGTYKMVSTLAKQARGMMARYIIDERITQPKKLVHFTSGGYQYDATRSQPDHLVFVR
ncbi:MAG: hypothetical protein RLZZ262_462 [Bacteroidota bacterium]|jgi:uncharacterized protein